MKKFIITVTAAVALFAGTLPSMLTRGAEGPLDSVAIDPASALVAANGARQFTAIGKDSANQTVSNVTYNWSVVAGGGTINATSGLFTAGNETGTVNNTIMVTAVQGNITRAANATVTVAVPGQLVTLEVSPSVALIPVNDTRQFTAIAKDAFNENATGVNYTWAVVAGGGTINSTSGLFTAGNTSGTFDGTVQVTAVQGNITKVANADAVVAVPGRLAGLAVSPASAALPVNGSQQFTAVARDAFNQNATGVNFTWSVVAGGGTINSTSGLFTAGNTTGTYNGTVLVTAVQGNISLTADADVILGVAGELDHVVISPEIATVTVNTARQFTAVAKDVYDNNLPNVTYNWSVVAGGGTINASGGLFTAGNTTGTYNGTVKVTATIGNITKIANASVIVVNSGILDHVTVSPVAATVAVNKTQQFTAAAKDSQNDTVNATLTWKVVAGGGTINATSGLFTAGNTTGTYNCTVEVTAVQGNITETAYATVTVVAPAEKECNPPGWEKGEKKGWDGKNTPPGWEQGKKQGWDDEYNPGNGKHGDDRDEDENEAEVAKPEGDEQQTKGNNGHHNERNNRTGSESSD